MRSRIRFMLLVFCVAGVVDWASAQQPILRVRVEPRTVVVGEPVKVTVDVLVPTWFTKAPTYPRLEIPGAIAVLRKGPSLNLIERIDGDTWAGISRSYLVYPQEQKLYTLPPAEVEVIYAREGTQSSQPVRLKFPPRTFEARIPDEAAGLDYFIATSRLRLTQTFDRSFEELKVGDAIQRMITINADNTFSMFLPPLDFGSFEGLTVYVDPPEVEDEREERSDFFRGRRVESATYLIQVEGEYELPEIEVVWWDLKRRRIRRSTLAATTFTALPNPDYVPEIAIEPEAADAEEVLPRRKSLLDMLKEWGLPGAVVAILFFVGIRWGQMWVKRLTVWYREKRKTDAESEATYFDKFCSACKAGDERAALRSLFEWLDRTGNFGREPMRELIGRGDAELRDELLLLESRLFSIPDKSPDYDRHWSGNNLYKSVDYFRKRMHHNNGFSNSGKSGTLPDLNPGP